MSQEFENITQDFWNATIYILEIDDVLKRIENLSQSAPQAAEQYKINALILLLREVKNDACEWVRHSYFFPGVLFLSLYARTYKKDGNKAEMKTRKNY